MRSSRSVLAILFVCSVFAYGCADDSEGELHLSSSNGSSRGGGGSGGGGVSTDTTGDGRRDVDETVRVGNEILWEEVVYLHDNTSANRVEVRSLHLRTEHERTLWTATDHQGKPVHVETGDLALTPLRQNIIYASNSESPSVFIQSVAGGQARALALDRERVVSTPRVLGSGDDVIFVESEADIDGLMSTSTLYRAPLRGGEIRQAAVTSAGCDVLREPVVLPNTQATIVAILERCSDPNNAGVYRLNLDTGEATRFMRFTSDDPATRVQTMALSPDGNRLMVLAEGTFDTDDDMATDAEGAGVFQLNTSNGSYLGLYRPPNPVSAIRAMAVSPEGNALLLEVTSADGTDLIMAPIGAGAVTHLSESGSARSPISF